MKKTMRIPLSEEDVQSLQVGDMVYLSGEILCGRDAVLPKIVDILEKGETLPRDLQLNGSVVFHTAVSVAGVGPTSSNKLEIESSMAPLSKFGVKLHLGKGAIQEETMQALQENNSVFAVIPPVTALLEEKTLSRKVLAFPELGMEALHALEVDEYPAIIAVAHGRSIYK